MKEGLKICLSPEETLYVEEIEIFVLVMTRSCGEVADEITTDYFLTRFT